MRKINLTMPPEFDDDFTRWLKSNGLVKWKAMAGAWRLLRWVPAAARAAAMQDNEAEVLRLLGLDETDSTPEDARRQHKAGKRAQTGTHRNSA